jgi:hypothetical protein
MGIKWTGEDFPAVFDLLFGYERLLIPWVRLLF